MDNEFLFKISDSGELISYRVSVNYGMFCTVKELPVGKMLFGVAKYEFRDTEEGAWALYIEDRLKELSEARRRAVYNLRSVDMLRHVHMDYSRKVTDLESATARARVALMEYSGAKKAHKHALKRGHES